MRIASAAMSTAEITSQQMRRGDPGDIIMGFSRADRQSMSSSLSWSKYLEENQTMSLIEI